MKLRNCVEQIFNDVNEYIAVIDAKPCASDMGGFPISRDFYLANKGYREAIVSNMDYVVIFAVREDVVNIVGFFHQLESYQNKL